MQRATEAPHSLEEKLVGVLQNDAFNSAENLSDSTVDSELDHRYQNNFIFIYVLHKHTHTLTLTHIVICC